MIEQKFGASPELENLKQLQQSPELVLENSGCTSTDTNTDIGIKAADAVGDCIWNKLKANFKELLYVNGTNTIVSYIKAGNYTSAAKKMIAVGVKGNIPALVIQVSYYLLVCEYEVNGYWG